MKKAIAFDKDTDCWFDLYIAVYSLSIKQFVELKLILETASWQNLVQISSPVRKIHSHSY